MGDALTVGSLLAVLATAVSPAPATPAPSPLPLREIGHVRATTAFCQTLLADATDAVTAENTNDAKLGEIYASMRTSEFDANRLVKFKSSQTLNAQYVALRASAMAGLATVQRLHDESQASTDDAQRKALNDFSNSLGGALYRQKVLADDLGRFIAYLDTVEPISREDRAQMQVQVAQYQGHYDWSQTHLTARVPYTSPIEAIPPLVSSIVKAAADEFTVRARPIGDDERKAAGLVDPAFSGC